MDVVKVTISFQHLIFKSGAVFYHSCSTIVADELKKQRIWKFPII